MGLICLLWFFFFTTTFPNIFCRFFLSLKSEHPNWNINAYYLIVILSIYFSVNLLSFFASNFILFQNDTKLYCQRQFVRRRNRPTDQTRFQHGFNSWDFYSESSWRRHCEQNWFQKWQILSPLFLSTTDLNKKEMRDIDSAENKDFK